jgi:hypothetical protein
MSGSLLTLLCLNADGRSLQSPLCEPQIQQNPLRLRIVWLLVDGRYLLQYIKKEIMDSIIPTQATRLAWLFVAENESE